MSDSDTVASCQGLTWGYDAWANRTAQTVTKGTCGQWSSSYTANNQISGYSYDATGNLLNDGVHSYTYDAEGRIVAVDGGSTATYLYDPEGRRKLKTVGSTTTSFIYDLDGRVIADFQTPPGGWWAGYVYAGSRFIAEYTNSTTYFMQADHLGSTRLMTAMNQSIYDSMDFLPFGEQIQGASNTTHKFTGKERDAESNLDNFEARYYSSQIGRFMSPDWSETPDAVPYADFVNPQTLNLYAMVHDSPETFADLDGHDTPCGQALQGSHNCTPSNPSHTAKTGEGQTGDGTKKSDSQDAQTTADQAQALKEASSIFANLVTAGLLSSVDAPPSEEGGAVDTEAAEGTAAAEATTTVMHVTGDAGVAGITESGGVLLAGTYVTLPSEIPTGASAGDIESLLEINTGKGANSITFDTPNSNLVTPSNGPTTSGGAKQFQLVSPTKVDPFQFVKTPVQPRETPWQ